MNNINWEYNSAEDWYQVPGGVVACESCGKEAAGVFFMSEKKSVCLSCVLKNTSEVAGIQINHIKGWSELLNILHPESSPVIKIGMLLNIDILLEVIEKMPEVNRLHLLHYITLSIGYNSLHPLSPLLRQIAINKIILGDDAFLRVLLDDIEVDLTNVYPIDPTIFRYNLALTLSYLAPYNKLTKNLIERISETAKERKDAFVLNWFVVQKGYYFPRGNFFSGEYASANLIGDCRIERVIPITKTNSNRYWIEQVLDEIYTVKYLKNIYTLYLKNIHEKADIPPLFIWPGKKVNKKYYVRIFAEILENKDLVKVFLEELPGWLRISFEEMLWEDSSLTLNEFRKRGNLKTSKVDKYAYEPKLPPESQLFQVWVKREYYSSRGEVILFLDNLQKNLFRSYIPVPENCELNLKDTYNSEYFISSNTEILSELQVLVVYLRQVGIKRSKNGIKILKSSIKDIRTVCTVPELYSDIKGLENLRLTMLIELVDKFVKKKKDNAQLSSDKFIKKLFSFYFNPKESALSNFSQFLMYLKVRFIRKDKSDKERFYNERMAVQKLLNQMVVGKWVEVGNIYRYFNSKGLMFQPVRLTGYVGDVYFTTMVEQSYGSSLERVDISDINIGEALLRPYLKLLLFVLNTLGVVDLAYTLPVNNIFQDKKNSWLSVYDGIKEVSLTALGAWLIGRTKTYEGIKKKTSVKVSLDNKRLIVTVEGKDPVIDLTLTRMARPLGSGIFIISSDIFLKGCDTAVNIKEKIKSFKTNICAKPPQNWEDFFTSLLKKADPLEYKKEKMMLFKLDSDNKDLIALLFSDPYLKWNIMKVEDYHILIKESSYKAVQARLAEHGYLLPMGYNL